MKIIDLNCDMGESTGSRKIGDDESIMPFISSSNIACGFHGGDPMVMHATVDLAVKHGVAIGAHPSFYDIEGFGRNEIALSKEEIYDLVVYQVSALQGFTRMGGAELHHVKPHGALYNMAARIPGYAKAIASAVRDLDPRLILYGLSGSELIKAGKEMGLRTCSEVFADRTYQDDGSLTPRSRSGAVIHEFEQSLEQVKMMLEDGRVRTVTGNIISIEAETICIHGDHEGSALFAKELNKNLSAAGFVIKAMDRHE
ncbi:MAG TPA: 5-oxoprolinase subunit PxpA [Chitinophagaceae bacterium]|nr:5-oxoprolinase subunit PxpA [Chitinophagaceae bacterium]